jgi:uncharacterized protein YciI
MSSATWYVLFYEAGDNFPAGAREHFPAHQARYQEFMGRGVLLALGPFADEPAGGALAIFTTREAAEEFATGDPFVLSKVVGSWHVRQWRVVTPDGAGLA